MHGKNLGLIKHTKINITFYRGAHQGYLHKPKRPAKEDPKEEHLTKKEEPKESAPGLGLQDRPAISRPPPARQGREEVDQDRDKAEEGTVAKGSNTPLMDHQHTSSPPGPI